MSFEASGLWSTFVHSAEGPSEVSGLWSTFVHSAEGPGEVSGLWTTFTHTVPAITATISNTPGAGTVGSPFTFIGSSSVGLLYSWTFTSKPPGSFVGEAIPFPDNGVTTPVDMTDNEGLWHFDGNANDTSGNARNGTVTGATPVAGYVGSQAYQFGVSDYIDFGAASTFLAAPDDFSISIWIKGDAAWTPVLYDAVLGFSNAFTWSQGVGLYFTNANTLRVFVGAYNGFFTEGTLGTVSDWNHVTITYISGTLRLYINGVEASNNTGGSTLTGLTDQLQVGRLGTYGNLEATLDEFAIWSRGLSPTEVADIYALQNVTLVTDQPDLAFTPDLDGTYEVQLDVSGYDGSGFSTDTATGTLVVGGGGSDCGPPSTQIVPRVCGKPAVEQLLPRRAVPLTLVLPSVTSSLALPPTAKPGTQTIPVVVGGGGVQVLGFDRAAAPDQYVQANNQALDQTAEGTVVFFGNVASIGATFGNLIRSWSYNSGTSLKGFIFRLDSATQLSLLRGLGATVYTASYTHGATLLGTDQLMWGRWTISGSDLLVEVGVGDPAVNTPGSFTIVGGLGTGTVTATPRDTSMFDQVGATNKTVQGTKMFCAVLSRSLSNAELAALTPAAVLADAALVSAPQPGQAVGANVTSITDVSTLTWTPVDSANAGTHNPMVVADRS